MSALGSAIGSRISYGCQSAQMGTCQLESVAVWHRTCASATYLTTRDNLRRQHKAGPHA